MLNTDVVGTWSLTEFRVEIEGRDPVHPFGTGARGRIVYTADGFVTAVLMGDGRSADAYTLESFRKAPVDDKADWFDSYLSYSGRWHLDGPEIVHAIDLSLVPSMIGQDVRRRAVLEKGVLTLSYTRTSTRGTVRTFVLTWERS